MDRTTLKMLLDRAGLKKVRGTGEGFQAVCPFHVSVSGQAGWKINAETGLWLCHKPTCAQKGNIVRVVARRSWPTALLLR
jgi:hypothetical protein